MRHVILESEGTLDDLVGLDALQGSQILPVIYVGRCEHTMNIKKQYSVFLVV